MLISLLYFLSICVLCRCFIDVPSERQVLENIRIDHHVLTIQPENSRSAVSIALELCRQYGEYFANKRLLDCILDVGSQIDIQRNDPTFHNAYYSNHTNVIIKKLSDIPVDTSYEYNVSARCDTLENGLCSNGGYIEESSIAATQLSHLYEQHRRQANNIRALSWNTSDVYCTMRHSHVLQEAIASVHKTLQQPSKYRGAIVILAQAGNHSSYNRHSVPQLMLTLEYLYKNFNDVYREDIWIFHEGDFDFVLQEEVRMGRMEIRFYTLSGIKWEVYPDFVNGQSVLPPFSIGYRKMIRFFSVLLWELMHDMGYTWVWRLDDDSFVLSPINYNVFTFMETYGYQYAYRNIAIESPGRLFWDFVQSYVIKHQIRDIGHIMDTCRIKTSIRNFTFNNCGHMPGYYNNLFVTNVSKWMEPPVQQLLKEFDESGMIFLERWGDLSIHSTVVRLLFDEASVHRFTAWGYAHFSGSLNLPYLGIMQAGSLDVDQFHTLKAFADRNGWDVSDRNNQSLFSFVNNKLLTLSLRSACEWHNYAICVC